MTQPSPFRRLSLAIGVLLAALLLLSTASFAQDTTKPKKKKPQTEQAAPATAPAPAPAVAMPSPEVLLILVRNAILALNQANFTGNYTVLRDIGSPSLQSASAADLAIAFANLRQQKVDLSPVLILTPALTENPAIAADGVLKLAGHFPTKPLQINFAMTFQPVGGIWRLHGLAVNTSQAQP
jgi:hypothetical protein